MGSVAISEADYHALIAIRDNDIITRDHSELVDSERAESLKSRGLVRWVSAGTRRSAIEDMEVVTPLAKYALTAEGEDAIALFEKSAKEHADQEEKERLERRRKTYIAVVRRGGPGFK